MRSVGLTATEFGPAGYLPADPAGRAGLLSRHGLTAAGGFVPVVLHDRAIDPVPEVDRALDGFGPPGAAVLVLAASTGRDSYEGRPALDVAGWSRLLANLDRAAARAAERGFTATLHPHAGTMIENTDEVLRVLDGSEIALCLDTGHLLIGGTDPAALAKQAAHRIGHVHLKDVRQAVAGRVRGGEISYAEGVAAGLYQPLGQGDLDVAGVVGALAADGYQGWYVLEQDMILREPPGGEGPVALVRQSLAYLGSLT
ncbi:MAG: TIM barrel protein [Streptosporangiaceae bacterium]|nr:TIM barrel protein [Streptosporangiaceae bacterium]MBV9856994.1 TIM barrel protein [Streptosporangiaceae bacterium]